RSPKRSLSCRDLTIAIHTRCHEHGALGESPFRQPRSARVLAGSTSLVTLTDTAPRLGQSLQQIARLPSWNAEDEGLSVAEYFVQFKVLVSKSAGDRSLRHPVLEPRVNSTAQ